MLVSSTKIRFIYIFCLTLLLHSVSVYAQIENLNFESNPEKNINTEEKPKYIGSDDLIHSGDLIDVDILGSTEYDWRGKVTPEGFITGLNFIDNVFALCRTEKLIAKEIANKYSKFLRKPRVAVKILDRSNRPVSTLLGEVKVPQRFQLKRKIFLNEIIILSGGLTEKANGEIRILRTPNINCRIQKTTNDKNKESFVKVSQDNNLKVINIKVSDLLSGKKAANPEIIYGDLITVFGSEPVYVIGGVNNPGKILFRDNLSVSRAITTAGGLTKKSGSNEIRVFRKNGLETQIIELNLESIKNNEEKDILLKPYDIVDVAGKESDRMFSPLANLDEITKENNSTLPLRVID